MQLTTRAYSHQKTAVKKMLPVKVAALFMEMGTGKSRTAIELVVRRLDKISNAIWFCPVSVKHTVYMEILKHTDCLQRDICMFDDKTNAKNLPCCTWYVVGIESMSASKRVIFAVASLVNKNSFVIVDESSYIKGHRSARTNWITNISKRSEYRLILTGTPISQGIVDLFAQMRFLSPKILGYSSFYSFSANHLEYSDKYPGLIVRSHNTEYIAAKIKPYVYQVTKEECLDLPDKLYKTHYFDMTCDQREYYEQAKDEILNDIDYEEFDSVVIFRLFTALQQVVCGFWNRRIERGIFDFREFDNPRLEHLIYMINQIPDDKKVIIWAKYNHDIDKIKEKLDEYGGGVSLFYGKLSVKKRNDEIQKFSSQNRFFIATPSSGGHGLTINEAHYVIFYNNTFKYSERLQAEDRNHRIGQEQKVTYIDVVCRNSIDERIQNALYNKGNIVEEFKREVEKVKGRKKLFMDLIKDL